VALERYGASLPMRDLADETVEPLTRLRAHFEFLRDETTRHGFTRGCLFGNFGAEIADHSETIRVTVQEALQQWAAAIAATLKEAQLAGSLRPDLDPEKTAGFLLDAWEGCLIRARANRSDDPFATFFTIAFGTLLA
jgi:TetR/AcrR family transcriptional repressor of nem operon